jgi:hypothetical protein
MYNIGDFVTYIPYSKCPVEQWQKGRVKSLSDKEHVFVVYHCNNDWDTYKNYTPARTNIKDLL